MFFNLWMICFYDATLLNKVPQQAVVYNATHLNELERRAIIVTKVDQTTVSIKVSSTAGR